MEVCVATGSWVFANAAEAGDSGVASCLSPGTGVAAGPYGSGYFVFTTPTAPASTNMSANRALTAGAGDQKYYVSNLMNTPRVYLVAYIYTVSSGGMPTFDAANTEDFPLTIG